MNPFRELKEHIAVSLYLCPGTEEELMEREFLKNYSPIGISRIIMDLEKDAIYYRGETIHIYKSWAKKNLQDYEIS